MAAARAETGFGSSCRWLWLGAWVDDAHRPNPGQGMVGGECAEDDEENDEDGGKLRRTTRRMIRRMMGNGGRMRRTMRRMTKRMMRLMRMVGIVPRMMSRMMRTSVG